METRDPRWESIAGGISTLDDGTAVVSLELRAEKILGYRLYIDPENRPYMNEALDKMVKRLDEALS